MGLHTHLQQFDDSEGSSSRAVLAGVVQRSAASFVDHVGLDTNTHTTMTTISRGIRLGWLVAGTKGRRILLLKCHVAVLAACAPPITKLAILLAVQNTTCIQQTFTPNLLVYIYTYMHTILELTLAPLARSKSTMSERLCQAAKWRAVFLQNAEQQNEQGS